MQGICMPLFMQAYGAGKTWLLRLYLDLLKQERVRNVLQARLFTPDTPPELQAVYRAHLQALAGKVVTVGGAS
jgi:hypothetical protein